MSRFILGVLGAFALMGAFVAGLDVVAIEGRAGATLFQQMVARLGFGFSVLSFILCFGFFGLINAVKEQASRGTEHLKALQEIAEATKASRTVLEAPEKRAAAEQAEKDAAEKKARYAEYRESVKTGGRIEVEAAMLANAKADSA